MKSKSRKLQPREGMTFAEVQVLGRAMRRKSGKLKKPTQREKNNAKAQMAAQAAENRIMGEIDRAPQHAKLDADEQEPFK